MSLPRPLVVTYVFIVRQMNKFSLVIVGMNLAVFALKAAQSDINPSHIDVYVTPYYNSKGPEVSIGRFSSVWRRRRRTTFLLRSPR
jgi:hypothetical protein